MLIQALKRLWYQRYPPKPPVHYRTVLERYSAYFRQLHPDQQQRFLYRLSLALKIISFVADGVPAIAEEMKILIGGAWIQTTFGLKQFIPSRFTTILVAPAAYTYREYPLLMVGDTNSRNNTVSLSWPHVQKGFIISDDASNVALHEIAHCLEIEQYFRTGMEKFFHDEHWEQWKGLAVKKLEIVRNQEHRVLSDYAGTNPMELFAVSVENFFEKSLEFKKELPWLYDHMVKLLNQDPTREGNPIIYPLDF